MQLGKNMQHKSHCFADLTYIMLLYYLGKIIFIQRFESCFLRYYVGGSEKTLFLR